jgi:hypothetical protein
LATRFLIARWRRNLEELSQNGGLELAENFGDSLFNEGLSIDFTFSLIHLDGQYR